MVVLIFNRLSVHTIEYRTNIRYDISLLPFLPLLFSPSLSPSLYITNRLLSMGTSGTQEEDAGINSKKGQEEGQGKGQGAPPPSPPSSPSPMPPMMMMKDDELAMVMGHEMSHIILEHSENKMAETAMAAGLQIMVNGLYRRELRWRQAYRSWHLCRWTGKWVTCVVSPHFFFFSLSLSVLLFVSLSLLLLVSPFPLPPLHRARGYETSPTLLRILIHFNVTYLPSFLIY